MIDGSASVPLYSPGYVLSRHELWIRSFSSDIYVLLVGRPLQLLRWLPAHSSLLPYCFWGAAAGEPIALDVLTMVLHPLNKT